MPELVIFVGLQASGKSTFYRERMKATHALVSKDLFPSARNRERRQSRLLRDALGAGRNVVLDNTNPSRDARRGPIAIARELGAAVIGFYFESRLDLSRERNAARPFPVPEVALRATAALLERPSLDEGFDALSYVAIRGDGFLVLPWNDDDLR